MAGRVMLSGMVHVKQGLEYKKRFLIARCQGSDLPARLEVFAVVGDIKSTVASKLQELSFNELKEVFVANEGSSREATKKLIILQTQEGEDLKFYSSSEVEHNTWYIYCYVLANIPTYPIPDVSHYQIPLDTFKQEMDPKRLNAVNVWRVYIINEGVGKTLKCRGFHNVTINRDSTISIINSSSQVPLVIWDRDKIRRSGCLESLVFLEAGRRCHGGPGMLWMYCPQSSVQFGECLHRFLFNKTTEDEATNCPSPMYPQNYASSPGQDLAMSMQASTVTTSLARPSCVPHSTDSSRHHPICIGSTRVSDLVQSSLTTSLGSLSEDCLEDNECDTLHTRNDNELPNSHSHHQHSCANNIRNTRCDASHKPPILPRKAKRNKPPVPPRTLIGPFANYSEYDHDFTANGTQTTTTINSPEAVIKPAHNSHHKQAETKETVVLRHHQRCRNNDETTEIEHNALLGCWVEFCERLDATNILPHLCSHHLLTLYDREKLTNQSITNYEKVIHLLTVLPKKDGWFEKFLDCLCQSAEGTGHAGLAAKLKLKYEEELKRTKFSIQTAVTVGSSNQERLPAKTQEIFPIYLESQDGLSQHIFNVESTELVESLVKRIHAELKITCPFDITLKVDPRQQKLHSRSSLRQSRVRRNSVITMVTHDSSK